MNELNEISAKSARNVLMHEACYWIEQLDAANCLEVANVLNMARAMKTSCQDAIAKDEVFKR